MGKAPDFILGMFHYSAAKTCIFLNYVGAELYFFNKSLNEEIAS